MSDDRLDDETYDFPHEEDKEKYSMSPFGGTESIKSLFKNKRLIMTVGGVLGFYLIIQLMVWIFVSKKDTTDQKAMLIPETVQPKNVVSTPVKVAEVKQPDTQVLSAQAEIVSRHTNLLKSVENKMSDIVIQQARMQRNLENLEKNYRTNIGWIGQYVRQQQAEARARLAAVRKVPKKAMPVYTYYTRAAIHGRAWLVQKNTHHNITVSVGDTVPSYGQVMAIDPDSGRITTASKRMIRYSEADR